MVRYSVLLPVRDASPRASRLVTGLHEVLDRLILPYEIICILDGPNISRAEEFAPHAEPYGNLRVLRFDRPSGAGAALGAGIAASRGEVILGVSPETPIAVDHLLDLIGRLGRYDLAFAQPARTAEQSLLDKLAAMPRWLTGRRAANHAGELFFAARREPMVGLALARGGIRLLPELVDQRGFRVCCVTIEDGLPPRGARLQPGAWKRMAARRHARRFAPYLAREHVDASGTNREPYASREDVDQPRWPQPAPLPLQPEHGPFD